MDNLTVFCLDGRDDFTAMSKSREAVRRSAKLMNCRGVLASPIVFFDGIFNAPSPVLENHNEYSQYLLAATKNFIETDFALFVQSDGFVLRPEKFEDEFLKYDYIGAPWPAQWNLSHRVGNGGFSLRSKRFLELSASLVDLCKEEVEDVVVCRTAREIMEDHGMKYAPVEVAARFSLENYTEFDQTETFGFHGRCNNITTEYCKTLDLHE